MAIFLDKAVGVDRGVFIFFEKAPSDGDAKFVRDGDCYSLKVNGNNRQIGYFNYLPESLCSYIGLKTDLHLGDTVVVSYHPPDGAEAQFDVVMTDRTLTDVLEEGIEILRGGQATSTNNTETVKEVSQALNTLSLLNSPRAGSGNGAVGDAAALLESELREVLHWRPRTNDTKGFLAALEQSFEEAEVRGLPTFVYAPRSYTVTTDLSGEITGAQASLYARAKLAVDESLKLLDGLTPLADSFDEEEADAYLAIIRQRMSDLTDELARPAGPRVARLDKIFDQLLGSASGSVDAENVGGRLGDLRDEYDLKVAADTVNTIEEEKTATDFRIIVDYLSSLHDAWDKARHFFNGQRRFLGTQLVWLERLLAAIAESSEEVRRALDSVLIGSLEQLSLVIAFNPDTGREPILVDDLLDWVTHFASEEGPRLIQEGGRTAITIELSQTAALLRDMVLDSLDAEQDDLPEEFFYPLVRSSFKQLYKHLDTLVLEANKSALGGVVVSDLSRGAARRAAS